MRKRVFGHMRPAKAKIILRITKLAVNIIFPIIVKLINKTLTLDRFPIKWKSQNYTLYSKVVKNGPIYARNYWRISILPTISKIFEKLVRLSSEA